MDAKWVLVLGRVGLPEQYVFWCEEIPSSPLQRCPQACSGAGASYGQWRMPWSPEERSDSIEIIHWITRQAWSNEQVGSMPCVHVKLHTLTSSYACAEHTLAGMLARAPISLQSS